MKKYKQSRNTRNAVYANKNLGQHFLTDSAVIAGIVDNIRPNTTDNFLEIGPGLGAITFEVLTECKTLTAIELDRRVIPILADKANSVGQLQIINQDVLELDFSAILADKPWVVFGNLPYNISTPILFKLTAQPQVERMVFMLQKEVVERMVAEPGEKNYGRLAIMLQLTHDIDFLFDIDPTAFSPPPKVMSSLVELFKRPTLRWQVNDVAVFSKLVKQAFAMRRKTLKNNLKPILTESEIHNLGVDASLRPEQISGEDFAKLSNFYQQKQAL